MTLADYLATEQAREDVRRMLNTMKTAIGSRCRGAIEGLWVDGSHDGAWVRIGYWDPDEDMVLCSAYYRPDGDRFIVTDLGEGVRARALRTGEVGGPMHSDSPCQIAEAASCMPRGVGKRVWVDGALHAEGIEAKDLPDAICRVMLASLRVAGVGR